MERCNMRQGVQYMDKDLVFFDVATCMCVRCVVRSSSPLPCSPCKQTASLDPYTEFETKRESEDNQIRFNGRYGGVGMGIERDWTIDAAKGRKLDPSRFRVSAALEGYVWDNIYIYE